MGGGVGTLAPPGVTDGYVRVAAVQLDFHPAALIEERSPLEDPLFHLGRDDTLGLPANDAGYEFAESCDDLRSEIRDIYCEQLRARVLSILDHCRSWAADLVVFPEYSIPPEILPDLLPASRSMCIVAGTHAVEQSKLTDGTYGRIGVTALPATGQAVAPVLCEGKVLALQPKLNRAAPERDLVAGDWWQPVELARFDGRPLGILICLDFLYRESDAHQQLVAPKLDGCPVLAVPSLTPHYTVAEFDAKAREEAKRYGRPVVYADCAAGGGTTVHADVENRGDEAAFPIGVACLRRGEEGVVVADLDLEYTRPAEKGARRYDSRPSVVPVCGATLVYSGKPSDKEYYNWVDKYGASVGSGDIGSILAYLDGERARLAGFAGDAGPSRKARLFGLLQRLGRQVQPDQVHRYLRDVFLPEDVFPLGDVRVLLSRGALDEVTGWQARTSNNGMVAEILDRLRNEVAR